MAVREFTAGDGRRWRAWDVTPETLEALTRAEDYLADCYRDGWVVFETFDGTDKRRLYPPPYGWEHRTDAQLDDLLSRAEILRPRRQVRFRGDTVVPADLPPSVPQRVVDEVPRDVEGDIDMRYLRVVRSFANPVGEVWRATLVERGPGGAPVLRFASESRIVDLASWPKDWVDSSDERLAELLRLAQTAGDSSRSAPPLSGGDSSPDATTR
jgi:hypothetical protein